METLIEFYVSDNLRKKAVTELSKVLGKTPGKKCENGIYEFTKQYCNDRDDLKDQSESIYNDTLNNLIFNFTQNNQTIKKLIEKVKDNTFDPYEFAFLPADKLNEDKWMKIILRAQATEETLNNLPSVEWKQCRNCKGKEYNYYQMQTRSADEPMTTFYICKNCSKTYRVNN